jgi:hypothetical protein
MIYFGIFLVILLILSAEVQKAPPATLVVLLQDSTPA